VPSWHYYTDPLKHQPYWEIYYATCVERAGHSVDIVDLRDIDANTTSLYQAVSKIPERSFFFYWIFKTGDAAEIYSIAFLLKKQYPQSIHAAGGTHVDMCPAESQQYFDALIIGPGETSFHTIIEDHRLNQLKPQYKQGYKTSPFDNGPIANRAFLPESKIVNKKLFDQYDEIKGTLAYFSRGCVFNCSFCTYNVPNYLDCRSGENIREEIAYLKREYQINAILVKDEIAISPNRTRSIEMLTALGDSDIIWRGQTTTLAKHEQLKLAKESGCIELAIGVETVDPSVMSIVNKKWQSKKQIMTFIENAKILGIKVKICLILGLPGESKDILSKTIRFLEETEPDYISVSGFLPVPGSPIFNDYKNYGIKSIDPDWNKFGHLLFRFSEEEEIGLPFEYEPATPWGSSFTRNEIIENIVALQNWARERSMTY
jgi:anaerobic magnesium-protoporphyrin IX monomethyl ester cyclase